MWPLTTLAAEGVELSSDFKITPLGRALPYPRRDVR